MPIRFRCHHCDQLLGIARRKANTHVRCPSCRQDVLVPATDQVEPSVAHQVPATFPSAPPPPVPPPPPTPSVGLFDRDDFDVLLQGGIGAGAAATDPRSGILSGRGHGAPPAPAYHHAPAGGGGGTLGLDRWAQPAHRASNSGIQSQPSAGAGSVPPGIVLSPVVATILTVAVILLIALAFGLGVVIGRVG